MIDYIITPSLLEGTVSVPSSKSQTMRAILFEGGIIEFLAVGVPAGLGDPVYQKLEAQLASAMMSLPAVKGFELGSGFECVSMKGSEHNDIFAEVDVRVVTKQIMQEAL
jgi:chorismate synthase